MCKECTFMKRLVSYQHMESENMNGYKLTFHCVHSRDGGVERMKMSWCCIFCGEGCYWLRIVLSSLH
jgi:hypothetical protein